MSQQEGQQPAQQAVQQSGELQTPGQQAGSDAAAQQQFAPAQQPAATSPYVDIYESPEQLTVFADLPGCRAEDVQLQATNNTLRISGKRESTRLGESDRPLQRERLDRIERTITLPAEVDLENAEATCENGVCQISLPKSEGEQQKRIGVQ